MSSNYMAIIDRTQQLETLKEALQQKDRQIEELLNIVFIDDEMKFKFRLQSLEFRTLVCLLAAVPGAVSYEMMMQKVYRGRPRPDDKVMNVLVHKLRRAMKPHGVVIETHYGFGYRLPLTSVAALHSAGWATVP